MNEIVWTDDKLKHYDFCYCFVIAFPKPLRPIGLLIAMLLGICKELIDWWGNGNPEWDDLRAGYIGAKDALKGTNRW